MVSEVYEAVRRLLLPPASQGIKAARWYSVGRDCFGFTGFLTTTINHRDGAENLLPLVQICSSLSEDWTSASNLVRIVIVSFSNPAFDVAQTPTLRLTSLWFYEEGHGIRFLFPWTTGNLQPTCVIACKPHQKFRFEKSVVIRFGNPIVSFGLY